MFRVLLKIHDGNLLINYTSLIGIFTGIDNDNDDNCLLKLTQDFH